MVNTKLSSTDKLNANDSDNNTNTVITSPVIMSYNNNDVDEEFSSQKNLPFSTSLTCRNSHPNFHISLPSSSSSSSSPSSSLSSSSSSPPPPPPPPPPPLPPIRSLFTPK